MKDAKGHGSDARGGPASYQNVSTKPLLTNAARDRLAAAHQEGVRVATAPMQRRQYEGIAQAINTFGDAHPEVHGDLARQFANDLQGSNPHYDRNKFQTAALTGDMGKTASRPGVSGGGMTRSHYDAIASTLNNFGRSHPDVRDDLASHFASALGGKNPNFNADRFKKAATK